jgi:hypothetical protein
VVKIVTDAAWIEIIELCEVLRECATCHNDLAVPGMLSAFWWLNVNIVTEATLSLTKKVLILVMDCLRLLDLHIASWESFANCPT